MLNEQAPSLGFEMEASCQPLIDHESGGLTEEGVRVGIKYSKYHFAHSVVV
jgi:hypothetical protein